MNQLLIWVIIGVMINGVKITETKRLGTLLLEIIVPHLLHDLSAPYLSRPPPSEGPSHFTSTDSENPLQQLLTKVDSLSEQQDKL